MFSYSTTIKLHETDAAGLLFFSNQFKLLHDGYEALLESIGFGFARMLREKDYFLPIVHASSDFKAPLFVGDKITIFIKVGHIGQTSFTFEYVLKNAVQKVVGTGRTVHVTINKKTRTKIPLPPDMKQTLKKLTLKNSADSKASS